MYSGEEISLEELMQKNSKWDKDHIYPQSKIKDDSLDNLVLARKDINNNKSNKLLPTGIQDKMKKYWIYCYLYLFLLIPDYPRKNMTV